MDFGVSVDEWELREHGYANLKYVMGYFFASKVPELDKILLIPEFSDYFGISQDPQLMKQDLTKGGLAIPIQNSSKKFITN